MRIAFACMGRENIEVEYLSAVCKAAGHQVELVYDPGSFSINDNVLYLPRLERRYSRKAMLVNRVCADPPDALVFITESITYPYLIDLARQMRRRVDVPIIFGGWHPTMTPHTVLANPEVDYVMIGESENTLPELLAMIAAESDPAAVPGIYYRENGEVFSTGIRPLIEDLDTLPWPDKDLFAQEVNLSDDYNVAAGRGCPGACTYCRENVMRRIYGPRVHRRRKVSAILDELEEMKRRYRFREVMISDPIFFTSKPWALELLAGFKQRIGVMFRCFGQIKFLDEEIAQALKDAGCYTVEFGLQTTNEKIRRETLLRPETDEDVRRAFAICDRYRLRYDIDHIFGLPGETAQDFVDAAHLYADCRYINRVKVHLLYYYPGAPILRIAEQMGLADADDRRAAESAEIGDISRVPSVQRPEVKDHIRQWKTFYKAMPLLGRRLGHAFIRRGWNRWFGHLPLALEIFLQVLVALRGRDYRFWMYTRYLFLRFRRHREVMREAKAKGWR